MAAALAAPTGRDHHENDDHAGRAAGACRHAPPPPTAQEVTLKAVTSFAEKTQFSKNFERFIDKVNADGKGLVQINYIGGPRAMPPFEVGNAVRTKVVDIANVTGAFYTNLMPEADALKLISKPPPSSARTAPSPSSSSCTTRSSMRITWRGSSTTCRSTSI